MNKRLLRFRFIPVTVLLFIAYFGFWWLYKLGTLPGLHGDEAWSGLKAYQFMVSGIDHLYGMNTYTGIFQPLVSMFAFKAAGLGVYQLRAPGVFFNLLALIIICSTLLAYRKQKILIFFLLIFSQSSLFLIAPRVAWEVNTFTLFFISLLMASVASILSDIKSFKPFWKILFLMVNILGTYNHVIFSCLSVAALIGAVLWSLYKNTFYLNNLILLLVFNAVNVVLVFVTMRYWLDISIFRNFYFPVFAILFILTLEIIFLKKLSQKEGFETLNISVSPYIVYGLLTILFTVFLIFHGMAIYQVMSNYKLIIHAYSYPFNPIIILLFLVGGGIIGAYFLFFLVNDIINGELSLLAFFIVVYLGLLSLYTTKCSFRYYLFIYPVICIYLAFRMSKQLKDTIPLAITFVGMILLINISLFKIFSNTSRPLKAIKFTIGNNQIETSAHFLPNKPLVDFLRRNKIGSINYLSDRYFLEQPILFYRLIEAWEQKPGIKAIIGYDYSNNKHGGYMFYRKE